MNPKRLYTPYTMTRCEPRQGWLQRQLETLLDVVVVAAVAALVWLAITDKDESGAEVRAATREVQSHE